ncbi:MAG: Ig-like domain-containing protein [Erysipelotrichaceae bacterium]|nr:Ig-like domain-containing protein [Erysipelotrichaceae bacterium]
MKKKSIILLSLMAALPFTVASCHHEQPVDSSSSEISSQTVEVRLDLSASEIALKAYDTYQLTCVLHGSDETINWVSEDPSIASVDQNGLITAQAKEGTTTVKAVAGTVAASCVVHVNADDTAPVVSLPVTHISLTEGRGYTLSPKVLWGTNEITNASTLSASIKEGENTNVVSLTQNGSSFQIDGVSAGSTVVLFAAEVRGFLVTAELAVDVNAAALVFDPVDPSVFTPTAAGYEATLAKISYGDYQNSLTLNFDVYYGGVKIDNPSISWSVENNTIATISGSVLTAASIGTTNITGTFTDGTHQGSITIAVDVIRPRIALNESFVVETGDLKTYSFQNEGALSEKDGVVYWQNKEVGSLSAGAFTLTKDALPISAKELGATEFMIRTENFEYTFPVTMYTLVIDNEAEFDQMFALAKANGTTEYFADGYFVLNADIDYDGSTNGSKLNSSTTYAALDKVGINHNEWGNGEICGFKGIFDGQGHVVRGLEVQAKPTSNTNVTMTSLFGTLYTTGIIRNVFFTEAKVTAEAAFLTPAGNGTIQNVYVQYDSVGLNPWNAWDVWAKASAGRHYSGTCFTWNGMNSVGSSAKIENLVVDARNAQTEEKLISGNHSVYLVSYPSRLLTVNAIALTDDEDILSRTTASYRGTTLTSVLESAAANQFVRSFDENEWVTKGENFLPKTVLNDWQSQPITLAASATEVHPGDSFTLTSNYPAAYCTYSSTQSGVSISKNTVTIVDDYDLSQGGVTIKATSLLDETISTTLTVGVRNIVTSSEVQKAYLNESLSSGALTYGASTIQADLSAVAPSGTMSSFYLNGVEAKGASYANGVVTIPSSACGTLYGKQEALARFATTDVRFTWLLVNQKIVNKTGVDSFLALAQALEPSSDKIYGGYFELGANIAYEGVFDCTKNGMGAASKWESGKGNYALFADNGLEGFVGTLDGMGYAISGMRVGPNYINGGFISMMGAAGVLRNIAFTGYQSLVTDSTNGTIVGAGGGMIENVYVERTAYTSDQHRVGLFFTYNGSGLFSQSITYRNVMVNDTAFNNSPIALSAAYPITGIFSKNATCENVFLATSDANDIKYFANKQNGGDNGTNTDDVVKHAATMAETYALASTEFKTAFDAIWQSGSGVVLSDGTAK